MISECRRILKMAAPMKRQSEQKALSENGEKRSKLENDSEKTNSFVAWAQRNNYLLTDKV